eukprot:Lithocolla_globosa_v1_NODE_4575_length_1407_cov_7.721893.p1 type:complete len:187 gc:universal NODE_4575_length_1407_cov_7.721893:563-3(-)
MPHHIQGNVPQGFKFDVEKKDLTVGFIESLQFKKLALPCDITVESPLPIKKAVAVVTDFIWSGNYTDPITINCRVSGASKFKLNQWLRKEVEPKPDVVFQLSVFKFDSGVGRGWYPTLTSQGADLLGYVPAAGTSHEMNLEQEPCGDVEDPPNYKFSFKVMPKYEKMTIVTATDTYAKKNNPWGLT